MVADLIKAIVYAGIPVGFFSFLMAYYAYLKGYLSPDVSIRRAFKAKKTTDKKLSKKNKKNLLFLHSKWVSFGGGFYGLIALLTFIFIELKQVTAFLLNATGLQYFLNLFSIDTLIDMFIDSIINMIKALIWFTYWPDVIHMTNTFVWILVAYVSYRIGANLAQRYVLRKLAFMDL